MRTLLASTQQFALQHRFTLLAEIAQLLLRKFGAELRKKLF